MIVIIIGFLAMTVCLAMQAGTLVLVVRYFAWAATRPRRPSWTLALARLSVMMMALMMGNIIQIVFWALIYRVLGGFDDLETAVYFSGVTFTTLGYGDVLLTGRIRMLAPLEAANGVMMFGLSSAALLTGIQRALAARSADRQQRP